MKKIKLISLLLVVVMIVGMFAGCNKSSVSQKDLEANPKAFIEAGLKKSFVKSPLGSILELENPEATSLEMSIKPEDEDLGHINTSVVFANNKLSALFKLDAEIDGEKASGHLFLDSENFAIKFNELKEIFGTDSIGIGLKDLEKNFKESAWYNLIKESGLEEEFEAEMEAEGLDEIDFDAIIKAYEKYFEELKSIEKDCMKYSIAESTIENEKKKIKCFEIKETISEDAVSKIEKALKAFTSDIADATGVDEDDLGIDEMIDEVKDMLKETVKNYSTTYVIEQKTGAMMKIDMKMNMSVAGAVSIDDEEVKLDYGANIDFGTDPSNSFVPSFSFVMDDGYEKISFDGKSEIDASKKAFILKMEVSSEYEDEDWNESYDMQFTLNEDSKFEIEISDGDDEVEFGGKLKIDGAKLSLDIDVADIEDAELGKFKITVDFNAKTPTCFKYDDLLKWDNSKISELLEKFGVFEDPYDEPLYGPDFEESDVLINEFDI